MTDTEEFESVKCTKETPKALLVSIDGKEHWVPKSVVDDGSEVLAEGDEGKLVLANWFAERELG
jgi:hypothetical protein